MIKFKHKVFQERTFVVCVPYQDLMRLIGVPKGANVSSIRGDRETGLTVRYSEKSTS